LSPSTAELRRRKYAVAVDVALVKADPLHAALLQGPGQ
jgi:hypothetical protein